MKNVRQTESPMRLPHVPERWALDADVISKSNRALFMSRVVHKAMERHFESTDLLKALVSKGLALGRVWAGS